MRENVRERFAVFSGSAPFLLGFAVGIALLVMGRSRFLGDGGMMGTGATGYLGYLEINRNRLFLYVVKLRMRTVFMMLLLSFTPLGRWIRQCYSAWYGLAFGMVLTAAYAVYGAKGLWLVCVCLFPQILIYVPAFILLCKIAGQIYDEYACRYTGAGWRRILVRGAGLMILVMLGCLAEGYVNPIIVMKMLKNF